MYKHLGTITSSILERKAMITSHTDGFFFLILQVVRKMLVVDSSLCSFNPSSLLLGIN
jgi:hypothetical protein